MGQKTLVFQTQMLKVLIMLNLVNDEESLMFCLYNL